MWPRQWRARENSLSRPSCRVKAGGYASGTGCSRRHGDDRKRGKWSLAHLPRRLPAAGKTGRPCPTKISRCAVRRTAARSGRGPSGVRSVRRRKQKNASVPSRPILANGREPLLPGRTPGTAERNRKVEPRQGMPLVSQHWRTPHPL